MNHADQGGAALALYDLIKEIKNDYLIIDDTIPDGYEIIIKGSSCEEELSTTKTIKVKNNNFIIIVNYLFYYDRYFL